MNQYVFVSILLLAVQSTFSQYCTAICMTKFQHSISDITGSSETTTMLAPFHKIISSTNDNKSAHKQIRSLCTKVKSWETCVRSCSRDTARAILLSSMDQWKKFCAVMRKPTRASNEYLNCERDHQRQVSKHCDMYMPTTFTVTVFCKSLEKYRDCSDRYMHYCSDEAFLIKKAIDDAIQHSFEKVIKFATNRIRLPQRCNMYHRSHHYKKHREEIDSATTIETTFTTTELSVINPTTITLSPELTDIFARQIEMSKIDKVEDPCDCETKRCLQKCISTVTPVTTTTLSQTTTTTFESTTFTEENSKESQLLVNSSYLSHFYALPIIIFIIMNFYFY